MVTNFCCAAAGADSDVSAINAAAARLTFFILPNFICVSLHFS